MVTSHKYHSSASMAFVTRKPCLLGKLPNPHRTLPATSGCAFVPDALATVPNLFRDQVFQPNDRIAILAAFACLLMETFFSRLKNEMFYGFEKDYPSFESFSKAIADYIDYYNNSRIQSKTKWMPPSKFREASMMKS